MRRLLLQLFFVSQIILLVAWSPFSSHETEIYPGKIVNTEILSTEHNYYFDVKQVISGNIGYIPCFQLNLYDKAILTKIGIREKIVYHYSGKGNSRKLLKKEILKGEFLEDPSEKVS
ncbi:MAG: hypothetical protein U9O87_09270, partial [Verrucomicrobiota bacterium]|nr:hypothetical protein [Verrucomicrobiota bacterium]